MMNLSFCRFVFFWWLKRFFIVFLTFFAHILECLFCVDVFIIVAFLWVPVKTMDGMRARDTPKAKASLWHPRGKYRAVPLPQHRSRQSQHRAGRNQRAHGQKPKLFNSYDLRKPIAWKWLILNLLLSQGIDWLQFFEGEVQAREG